MTRRRAPSKSPSTPAHTAENVVLGDRKPLETDRIGERVVASRRCCRPEESKSVLPPGLLWRQSSPARHGATAGVRRRRHIAETFGRSGDIAHSPRRAPAPPSVGLGHNGIFMPPSRTPGGCDLAVSSASLPAVNSQSSQGGGHSVRSAEMITVSAVTSRRFSRYQWRRCHRVSPLQHTHVAGYQSPTGPGAEHDRAVGEIGDTTWSIGDLTRNTVARLAAGRPAPVARVSCQCRRVGDVVVVLANRPVPASRTGRFTVSVVGPALIGLLGSKIFRSEQTVHSRDTETELRSFVGRPPGGCIRPQPSTAQTRFRRVQRRRQRHRRAAEAAIRSFIASQQFIVAQSRCIAPRRSFPAFSWDVRSTHRRSSYQTYSFRHQLAEHANDERTTRYRAPTRLAGRRQ